MPRPDAVLDFWFGASSAPDNLVIRPQWFRKDPVFDAEIATRFGTVIQAALAGYLHEWTAAPQGTLALIIVLDQFTRNTGRGSALAFAGDAQALALAKLLVNSHADRELPSVQRSFAYLPFEHSESISDQNESVRLFTQLAQDDTALADQLIWAQKHRDIVERWGRFPHRNVALGRESTAEELVFLTQPGSGF